MSRVQSSRRLLAIFAFAFASACGLDAVGTQQPDAGAESGAPAMDEAAGTAAEKSLTGPGTFSPVYPTARLRGLR